MPTLFSRLFGRQEPAPPSVPAPGPAVAVLSVKAQSVIQPVIDPTPIPQSGPAHNDQPVPYYPRRGPAVPAVPPLKIVNTQDALLREVRQASALAFDDFDNYFLPVVVRYAEFVHLLPASEYDHHSDLGGLYRHGLEVALNASRRSEGKEFALNEVPSVRKFQIFRWRACAMLGGMLHDLGKAVIDVGASDVAGERIWNPHVQSLWNWLQEHQIEHYNITWREERRHKEHDAISATALARMIPEPTLRWLGEYRGRVAYDAMLMALAGSNSRANPLVDIIKGADGDSVALDRAAALKRMAAIGEAGSRSHAAQVVRAMRERLLQGKWKINELGHILWNTEHGLYAMYPQCAKDAIEHLREQGLTTLPNEPPLLLSMMREAGTVVPNVLPTGESFDLHRVKVSAIDRDGGEIILDITAIKFDNDRVVPDVVTLPPPIKAQLCDPDGKPLREPGQGAGLAASPAQAAVQTPVPTSTAPESGSATAPGAEALDAPATSSASAAPVPSRRRHVATADPTSTSQGAPFDGAEPAEPGASTEQAGATTQEDADGIIVPAANAPLRDWGAERDPRDAVIEDNLAIARSEFPPTSVEGAERWLEGQSLGCYLGFVVFQAREAHLRWDRDLVMVEDLLLVRYPLALAGCGIDPTDALDKFAGQGWLELDPLNPARKVVTYASDRLEPFKAIRFTHGVTRALLLLLPPRIVPAGEHPTVGPHIVGPRASLYLKLLANEPHSPVLNAIFRAAFYDHMATAYPEAIGSPMDIAPAKIHRQLKAFLSRHGKPGVGLASTYLTKGDTPLLKPAPNFIDMEPVLSYDRGADENMIQKALIATRST